MARPSDAPIRLENRCPSAPVESLPRVVGARRVVELGPRHGHEVGAVGDVEVSVGAVGDVAVVEPEVVRGAVDRHGVVPRRAADRRVVVGIERAVADAVADDLDVADDDVRRAAEPEVAVNLGAAQPDDRLVRADADLPGGEHALDVDDGGAGSGGGRGERRFGRHRLRRGISAAGRRGDAHARHGRPPDERAGRRWRRAARRWRHRRRPCHCVRRLLRPPRHLCRRPRSRPLRRPSLAIRHCRRCRRCRRCLRWPRRSDCAAGAGGPAGADCAAGAAGFRPWPPVLVAPPVPTAPPVLVVPPVPTAPPVLVVPPVPVVPPLPPASTSTSEP